MVKFQFHLADDLAQQAEQEGLLTDDAITQLLERALRRAAGRRLLDIVRKLHKSPIARCDEAMLSAEIRAVRREN